MNNSDSYQSPHRKRRKEEFQHQNPPQEGPLDNDMEEHASPSGGQLDQLEAPSKKKKRTDNFLSDAQQEKRSDKSKGPQSNRTKNPVDSRQHTDHISINIENNLDSSVSNEQDPPAPAGIRVSTKGYCGLVNQGATCYLNAVLQTLFMTEEFRTAVKELKIKREKSVSFALQKLFRDLESKTGSVETNRVTNALHIGNVCEQQDAAEYYQKILSEIDENPAKIFQGKKKYSTICRHGNHEPIEEIISFFSLAIAMDSDQHPINVQKSLNAQFDKMLMDGEDQLFCEKCNTMTDMEMKCTISELPEVLTLHLQRFYLDYNYMTFKKNNCRVQIPLQLLLQEKKDVHHKYDLYAIVNHTGSLSGGHYYADIKSFDDHQWYQFNDSAVYRIDNVNVRHIDSDTACLLFFRKSDAQQESRRSSTPDVSSSTAESNNQSEASDNNSLKERPASETSDTKPVMDNQTEEENHPSPAGIREKEKEKPEESDILSQELTDSNTETEAKPSQTVIKDEELKSTDADIDNQSEPNITFRAGRVPEKEKLEESRRPEGCVLFTVDSDNDEAGAQLPTCCMKHLSLEEISIFYLPLLFCVIFLFLHSCFTLFLK